MSADPYRIERHYERARETLDEQRRVGLMGEAEFREEMRELDREERDDFERASEEAQRELDARWGMCP